MDSEGHIENSDPSQANLPWWKRTVFPPGDKWWNRPLTDRFSFEIARAIEANIGFQLVITFFIGGMILDGGFCASILLTASAAYWISVAPILVLRPKTTSKSELLFLRVGWVILIPLSLFSMPLWGWLRELLKWN